MKGLNLSAAPLPREHGAWPMFIVPVLVGIGAAGTVNGSTVLFALTAVGFFLVRCPLMLAIKSRSDEVRRGSLRWSIIYGAPTAIAALLLLATSRQWLLIPLGGVGLVSLSVYLVMAARRAEMSAAGELIGIAGLAIGAPGAYLVSKGMLDVNAVVLYGLNLLYFGGTVFYVKFKVREQPRLTGDLRNWQQRLWAGRVTVAYHTLVLAVVGLFAVIGVVPALASIAFVPMECKALGGVMTRPARLNIRRLGVIELGLTALFAAFVLLAYR